MIRPLLLRASSALCLCALLASVTGAQEWPGHRGGPARTGSVDGKPGPATPKILWSYASKEHFLAPTAVGADRLLVVAMGAFNSGSVRAFGALDGKPVWNKSAPLVRLPTVGTPAVVGGMLYLGEGMHQTDGSSLHAMRAADGRSLWRLEVPGELVHIEASPSVVDGRVYVGAGSGGVLCADGARVTLEGKELPLAEAAAAVDAKWKVLVDAYEKDKKKDPDFAIPPNEATLPCPAPKLVWEKGKGAWHVDAPVLAVKDRVYVASAFLDKEQKGVRALFCLNAADGAELWKAPLALNAWGGATLAGDLLLVPCSSIRYDAKELPDAKGEIVAIKAADGGVAWRRPTSGAVLATLAAVGDLAIACDTSGQVTAMDVKTGQPKWTSKTGHPYFAGAAAAGDVVYTADIEGVLHALGLADGKKRWSLDVAAELKAPGMVYGGPALHGGRIYLATANLEGKAAGGATAVVCIGEGK